MAQPQIIKTTTPMQQLRNLIRETLALSDGRMAEIADDTPLLGNIPELDSMAVAAIISAMEEQYGFVIEDDDIDAETFATLSSLLGFVQSKLASPDAPALVGSTGSTL